MSGDGNPQKRPASRRTFLKVAGGTAALGFVAGCLGGGNNGGGSGGTPTATAKPTATPTPTPMQFPQNSIKFIVPYGPGGGYDFYVRSVAKVLMQDKIVPVDTKVENVEGASGITAANQVYSAKPDGYTNMIVNTGSFCLSQLARPDAVKYDMSKFTALPRVAGTTMSAAVSTQSGINTGDELLAAIQKNQVKFGNEGPNESAAIMFKSIAALGGLDFTVDDYNNNQVTFNGKGEWYTAIKQGTVDVMAGSFSSLRKYVDSGDLKFVMVLSMDDSCPAGAGSGCQTFAQLKTDLKNKEQIINLTGGPYHRIFVGPPGMDDNVHNYLCEKITAAIQSDTFKSLAQQAKRPILYGDCTLANKGIDGTLQTYKDNKDVLKQIGVLSG